MFRSKIVIAALGMYALVVGCTLFPSEPLAPSQAPAAAVTVSLDGLPYCGASMQLHDPTNLAGYEKACDEIASIGGDTVMFVPLASMENASSDAIYIDQRHTLADADLRKLIAHAKADRLRVVLMPIVLLDKPKADTDWRGTIHPDDWDEWFSSYDDLILYYANLCEQTGVNVLVVGSELVTADSFTDEWRNLIRKVRNEFHGQLTYSSNWDHYVMVQFWNDLDMVGMNSYWKLGPDDDPDVATEEIERRWTAIQKDLLDWQKTVHKPILLLEGPCYCSLANASYEPWDYTRVDLALDLDLQKRLYEGFYASWWGKPQCAGTIAWEWTPESPGGPQDKGYTPRGKPAADVMREWLAKARWAVR